MTHTKGKWFTRKGAYGLYIIETRKQDDKQRIVAEVNPEIDGDDWFKYSTLIASAPELLEALNKAIDIINEIPNLEDAGIDYDDVKSIHQAIAKAEGREA